MANNKVQLANGTVLIDLTDTTATASDVASGSYFYNASGVKQSGTLVVDQTYSVSKALTNVTSSNDDTKVIAGNSFYADLTPTSGYAITSITVTMGGVDVTEQVFKPGTGAKAITANGTYNASDDSLIGYDRVVVNVSGGSTPTGSISISQNGSYDVTDYATAIVSVQAETPTITLLDTITVSEQVSDIRWTLPTNLKSNPILYVVGTVTVSASDWLYTQFDTLATNTASYTSKGTTFNLAYRIVGYPKVTIASKAINGYTLAFPVGTNRITSTSQTSFDYLRIFPYTSTVKITSASLSIYGMSS